MFLRFLLVGALGYWAYRMFKGPKAEAPKTNVKGKPKSEPLDLNQADVQDATFEDVDES